MSAAAVTSYRNRELLSQRILEILNSWPELHRQVFVRVHYWGDTAETISRTLGLQVGEVRTILTRCERRLCRELRPLREDAAETDHSGPHLQKDFGCHVAPMV